MLSKLLIAIGIASCTMTVNAASNRPSGYKTICKSGQTCSVADSTKVAFGTSGKFVTKTLSGTFKCDVATFGKDPMKKKKKKECSVSKKDAEKSKNEDKKEDKKDKKEKDKKNDKKDKKDSKKDNSDSGNSKSRKSECGSSPKGKVKLSSTKKVSGSFDGGCKEYVASFGDSSQKEGQDPVFRLEGGSIKNVFVGPNGDGIHVYGGGKLTNITWRDVAEDAMTVKSAGKVTISNFEAYGAADKVFQLNAKTTFKASNCTVKDMGKMFRENGGKCYPVTVTVDNCNIEKASDAIFRSDCKSSSMKISNSSVKNAKVCYNKKFKCSGG